MFYRLLLLILIAGSSLLAEPSIAEVQQAVSQNPALLETPQAKALMQEKGVTIDEINQKLSDTTTNVESEQTTSDIVENDIETTISEKTADEENLNRGSKIAKRINPFSYKTEVNIRTEAGAKQQSANLSKLTRYSASFYANKNTLDVSSLPTPDDYIVSTGDTIGIHIYGDRDTNYKLTIRNDGTLEVPYIGPIKIAGMTFVEAQKHLMLQLKSNFKNSDMTINIDKYSTIQVTLIGDVKSPGVYNLSSFSRVKDLLIVAKGVRETGSVREIIVKRNSKVIAKLDFYDLLFKGNTTDSLLLKQGDVVVIQKAEKLVSIDGYVNNTSIFELKDNESLEKLIEYAGGMKPDAAKAEIKIDRYSDNSKFETFKVSYEDSKNFQMKNGDKVYIYPLDFSAKNSINVYGNIIRPGSYKLNDKKTLNEFFKISLKDGMKKFFLPNTNFEYGVIHRYSDDLKESSKSFNLLKVINNEEEVTIAPNDKIYIYSLTDIYTNSYVTTKGSPLLKAGKLQYIEGMTIQDAINASGINGVLDDQIRVTTYVTDDLMPKTLFYSLESEGNTLLNPYDEVEVYDYYSTHILEPVSIKGEVVNPTTVYYEKGMTAAKLLSIAGGFNKTAYTKSLNILRYYVDENQTRQQKVINYNLDETTLDKIYLEPYDEIRISKILAWEAQDYDVVSISGEVHNPIQVKFGSGMNLSDLIVMAGGLTKRAYNKKIEIVRYYVDENQTRQRDILEIDLQNKDFSEIALQAYDEVKIFTIPNWSEKKSITLLGEVKFPGVYTVDKNERLSDVLKRAGGFTNEAFLEGSVFTRERIKNSQIKQYNESLAKIKKDLALYSAMPANAKNAASSTINTNALDSVIKEAEQYQPIGRVSLTIDMNIDNFVNSEFNLVLEDGDTLTIPSQIDTVTVFGEVFNPTSFVYTSNKDVYDYIAMASGLSRAADENNIYVIHADGTSEPINRGLFSSNIKINKGDTIVVPMYIKEANTLDVWDSVSKILSSFALTIAAMNSLGVF